MTTCELAEINGSSTGALEHCKALVENPQGQITLIVWPRERLDVTDMPLSERQAA